MVRKRGTRIVIVVEDSMLGRFCRTVLLELGYHKREIRVEMASSGKGSAKQWVDARLAIEVAIFRTKPDQRLAVLVGSDVDELDISTVCSNLRTHLKRLSSLLEELVNELHGGCRNGVWKRGFCTSQVINKSMRQLATNTK